MAAIESGIEHVGDRSASAARWLRGLMALGAVTVVLAAVHRAIATVYDFEDPNEGDPWDLEAWEWALVAAPICLPLAAAVMLIVAGAKHLAGLRAGEAPARMKIHTLSYVTALGTALFAAYTYMMFGFAESGFGIENHSLEVVVDDLTNGRLNPVGWMGVAAFVGLVVLFAGSVLLAALTRPVRD
jgi:hypothetical protein